MKRLLEEGDENVAGEPWSSKAEDERGAVIAAAVSRVIDEVEDALGAGETEVKWSLQRHERSDWHLHADTHVKNYKKHRHFIGGGTGITTTGKFRAGGPLRGEVLPTRSSVSWGAVGVRPAEIDRKVKTGLGGAQTAVELEPAEEGGVGWGNSAVVTKNGVVEGRDNTEGMRMADLRRSLIPSSLSLT